MGVKIRTGGEEKPLFEAVEPGDAKPAGSTNQAGPAEQAVKGTTKSLPLIFHMDRTPPAEGWNDMKDAPKDRPILVAVQIPSWPHRWAYYEVLWFQPPSWERAYWCIVGTQWHALWDSVPKGWREAIGHP